MSNSPDLSRHSSTPSSGTWNYRHLASALAVAFCVLVPAPAARAQNIVEIRGCGFHGGTPVCIDLTGCGIDPRSPGFSTLRVTFDSPIGGPVSYSLDGAGPFPATPGPGPNDLTLTASTGDQTCVTVDLTGAVTTTFEVSSLLGDIDGSGTVTDSDMDAIVLLFGEQANDDNGRADFDMSGFISTGDASLVRFFIGNEILGCPPCGACCLGGTNCVPSDADDCAMRLGGDYLGDGARCPLQEQEVAINEPGGGVFIHVLEAPIDCTPPGNRGATVPCTPGQPIDPWVSPADGSMCHNFGVTDSPAIPADFFGPGSDPFTGSVCLQGLPLGNTTFGDFGEADTLVRRSADPFSKCDLPDLVNSVTVDIEIVALSLVSVQPITVTFNGGQDPEPWDVFVDLSEVHTDADPNNDPPLGFLTAFKVHCNGGFYFSLLNVQPRFHFTKVGGIDPALQLDTGLESIPHVTLDASATFIGWVSELDEVLDIPSPICTDFHPGLIDNTQPIGQSCDCNGNLVHDTCDVENLTSGDCNANSIPDECDIDQGTSLDIDGDGIPDECPSTIPTVSEWGLAILAILLMVGGALIVRRRTTSASRT